MKTKSLLLLIAAMFLLPFFGNAQQLPDTTNLSVDMLQVPNSPAFALMDLAPSTVDEPKVPSDFLVYLRNATDSFTTIPRSYGVEFAPAWVFGRDNIDFRKFTSNNLGPNIWQSLTVSAGISHLDDPNLPAGNDRTSQLGIGLKLSLCRGQVEGKHKAIDSLYQKIAAVNDTTFRAVQAWFGEDAEWKKLDAEVKTLQNQRPIPADALLAAGNARAVRENVLLADSVGFYNGVLSKFANQLADLKAQVSGFKLNRRGFKLDFAGGFATDFYNQSVEDAQVTRIGGWLTGGWAFQPTKSQLNTSILGVVRLIGNPKQLYLAKATTDTLTADNLFLDYGGRLILHNGKRFSFSTELVGRMPVNNSELENTFRYSVNMDYQLTKTIVLSFHIGKNFDGTMTKNGNLITALQMFSSFGKRSYKNGKVQ